MKFSAKKIIWTTTFSVALASCSGDESDISPNKTTALGEQGVEFSYPRNNQMEVPLPAPMVIRFSSGITDTFPQNLITLGDSNGNTIDFTTQKVGNGRGLMLTPEHSLLPNTHYTLEVGEIHLVNGLSNSRDIEFTTRGLTSGPRSQVAVEGPFSVQRIIPNGNTFPILDFTSLRLQFNQPLAGNTAQYGDSISLLGPNGLVPAQMLVSGPYVTVDPDSDLTPGAEYQLTVRPTVQSIYGESFSGSDFTFTPKSSGSRSQLAQEVSDSQSGAIVSELTGQAINNVPLPAVLLGQDNNSQQTGDLYAELAHIPTFPNESPLRIKKGSLLNGSEMEVLIGGEVPAGFSSGPVSIRFISDAVGYMIKNPYSNSPEAPRHIILYMDVAISTGDSRASGAVTQNLLHQELVGTAIVKDGRLVVNAVSMVQPKVMGVEEASSLLSFNMSSYIDQTNAPPPTVDTTSPTLHSWVPDDYPGIYRPGDALIIQMSEPLDGETIRPSDNFTLKDGTGADVPFRYHQHGAALVVQPDSPLDYGQFYWIGLVNDIRDLSGNNIDGVVKVLDIPEYDDADPYSPIVLSAYPGFPCVLTDTDLGNSDAGRCLGGKADDDHLPLSPLPANRSINVTFSQRLNASTVNDTTFVVEKVDTTDAPIGAPISGNFSIEARSVTFTPDTPWDVGSIYRYTVKSVDTSPTCGTNAICDTRGLALQTKMLSPTPAGFPAPTAGGPNMTQYFQVIAPTNNVLLSLHNLPTADVNSNFKINSGEPVPSSEPLAILNSAQLTRNPAANPATDGTAGSGVTIQDANVGCGFDESDAPLICPDQTYIHPNGNLNADIVGFMSAAEVASQYPSDPTIPDIVKTHGGVLAYIYPTRLVMSGTVVHTKLTEPVSMGCNGGVGLCFIAQPTPTGPQLMRVRYTCDPAIEICGAPDYGRAKGWIVNDGGEARFIANLSLYLDAPSLVPDVVNDQGDPVPVSHDLYSKPLDLQLAGKLDFLDDGRQRIEEISANALNIEVLLNIAGLFPNEKIYLTVPAGATVLNYVSDPIKP